MEITAKQYVEEKARAIVLALREGDAKVVEAAIKSLKIKGLVYAAKDLESKLKSL